MNARLASLIAGAGAWALIGGVAGAVVGLALAAALPLALDRLESRDHRMRRVALEDAAADVAELLALVLRSGGSVERAVEIACATTTGPPHDELARAQRAVLMGAGPQAWTDLGSRVPAWQPFCAPIARALVSGAPVAEVLLARAAAIRRARRDSVLARARRLGISATIPVGLTLLPGFVLLAIVPLIASLATSLFSLP
jgi:pilus assembly protein TadC